MNRLRRSVACSCALGGSGIVALAWGLSQSSQAPVPEEITRVVALGSVSGQLSPCGCTSPMSGGIRRAATILREVEARNSVMFLDSGRWVIGANRQDLMKAQTIAQALASLKVSAICLTPAEAAFGLGNVINLNRLSGSKMVASQLDSANPAQISRWLPAGQFLIGAVTQKVEALQRALGIVTMSPGKAEDDLSEEAQMEGKLPVLIVDGNQADAQEAAERHPELAFILFAGQGDPPTQLKKNGAVSILNPADLAKHVVQTNPDGSGYTVSDLGPEVKDDPQVSAIYAEYLSRLDSADLVASLPRAPSAPFAGSAACTACHRESHTIWAHSLHARAMTTLKDIDHARDPDCVPCHTVGAHSVGGFRSIVATPSLASVGCESCHGPALRHARRPATYRLAKVGPQICASCHTVDQSPAFNFTTYWAKIRHSR